MRYLLDTNILSHLVRNPGGIAARKIAEVGEGAVCTSIIVACELRYGAAKKGSPKLSAQLEAILQVLEILPLEPEADRHYGDIRAEFERSGRIIGPNDLLIAAQALATGLTLVTDNIGEFARVDGLQMQNWLNEVG